MAVQQRKWSRGSPFFTQVFLSYICGCSCWLNILTSAFLSDWQLWTEKPQSVLLQVLMKASRLGTNSERRVWNSKVQGSGNKGCDHSFFTGEKEYKDMNLNTVYVCACKRERGDIWAGLRAFQSRFHCGMAVPSAQRIGCQWVMLAALADNLKRLGEFSQTVRIGALKQNKTHSPSPPDDGVKVVQTRKTAATGV